MAINNLELVLDKTFIPSRSAIKKTAIGNNGDYVIVLHGYFLSTRSMRKICKYLDKKNLIVFNCSYQSTKHSIEVIANILLKKFIDKYCIDKKKKIHLVGYSTGAIIIRKFLQDNPLINVGKVVQIVPPNHGSRWADWCTKIPLSKFLFGPVIHELTTFPGSLVNKLEEPCKYALGIIRASEDWLVTKKSVELEGAKDLIEIKASHVPILINKRLPKLVFNFLATSSF